MGINMKWNEILNEIERISKYDDGEKFNYQAPSSSQYKKLPGDNSYWYAIKKSWSGDSVIYMIDKDNKNKLIGRFSIYKITQESTKNTFKTKKLAGVNSIATHQDYRGKGIATSLYGIVLNLMGYTLISGDSQSPGGRKNWTRLNNITGVEVKGYLTFNPRHRDDYVMDKIIDRLMKSGAQYMGEDLWGKEYWAFDVIGGDKELTAYKNLFRIYDPMDVTTGLFAKWVGN